MNFVIAALYVPYPGVPHGGGQDLMALIRFLGQRHTVRLVGFAERADAAQAAGLASDVAALKLVYPAVTARQKLGSALESIGRGQWRTLGRRADGEVRAAIAEWSRAGQADVLLCAWTEMGRYLLATPRPVVRVLDEVDVRFIVEGAEAGRRRDEELGYCRAADLVLTRSARDRDALQRALPRERVCVRVLPPVAHTAELANLDGRGAPGRVLFVGALDRARNQQAVRWLVQSIWPAVLAECPEAVLRVAGANPPAEIQALGRLPSVEVVGYVPDLRAEYEQARVAVAPMRSEAGALNKVMDALAAGRPVVATRSANAGLGAPAEAMCLADDAASFAHAVTRLLQDDAEWQRQSSAGRRFAQAAFDWPRAAGEVEAALVELVNARREGRVGAH